MPAVANKYQLGAHVLDTGGHSDPPGAHGYLTIPGYQQGHM